MPVKAAVFQTGVGTRALFKATDDLDLTPTLLTLLAATTVVARGPKPTGALRGRGVRIDVNVPDPYTTVETLRELQALDLKAQRVVVQRYGATNTELERGLQQRGATVIEIPTYRWSMPQDTAPLEALLAALSRHTVASVVFTSASQADNLFSFAQGRTADLSAELNTTLVASVGPVCSAALKRHGVRVDVEASPPKLGPLIEAVDKALSDGRR
jgi:uroporphyrinogen-III synthase